MQNTAKRKKSELMLWEVSTPTGRTRTQNAPVRRTRTQSASTGRTRTQSAYAGRTRNQNVSAGKAYSQSTARRQYNGGTVRAYPVRSKQALKRRKARRRRAYFYRALAFFMIVFCMVCVFALTGFVYQYVREWQQGSASDKKQTIWNVMTASRIEAPEISTAFLEVNDFSRPGTPLKKIKNIFVHYTANPGTSAAQNRSYFANLAVTQERSASAHFIIGYEGEIVQCIPLDEEAYAVMTRNEDSISIECCYLDEDGKFTQETYDSLVHLLAWLTQEYKLKSDDILRHYDCGGKMCPLYYVEHEDAWSQLLSDVDAYEGE